MFGLSKYIVLVVLVGLFLREAEGWFRRRRRTVIIQRIHHHNTNNCVCNKVIIKILHRLEKLEKKVGKRAVAEILDLNEDYPGLDQFMENLGAKRDGLVDRDVLQSVVKRASQKSSTTMSNYCHCARAVVDMTNLGLLESVD